MRTGISYTKYSKLKELLKLFNTRNATLKRTLASTTKTDDSISQEEEGSEFASDREKYRGHRPTSMFQKVLLTTGSALMSLYDPSRGDMIATLGDVTADSALKYIKQKMEGDSVGQQILLEQPVINTQTVSIDYLGSLPENTFGKEYWRFLSKHGFSPDARLPVHYVDDPELVYVMLRYRQCHDLFHTILGMKPNMLGEVAVKWVEAIQTGLPMCSLGAAFGALRLGPVHRQKYISTYLPWAIRNGRNGKMLMCVYFEKHWERDLQELRDELNLEPPPEIPYPS
ncbi:ubiquinone biosynthesis protein COQ4 homolog, mitochondrial-like isoform X2 [Mercenaria mercenaria]|uniref:ubiquinone biosynthesis protein COQ4 homolog, mitochondrial-like isoform X2 n=1 Tax=Mercenaria mercenaria TaxID=6596 RepID=UPI001E1DB162|nr:ubiquinone biosynthesis protein COQ4 homolog, mitochondrial-like isoform X2 [Mercenaria mercenaria]